MNETDSSGTRRTPETAQAELDQWSEFVRVFELPAFEAAARDYETFRAVDALMKTLAFPGGILVVAYGTGTHRTHPFHGKIWPSRHEAYTRVLSDLDRIDARGLVAKVLGRARRAAETPVLLVGTGSIGRVAAGRAAPSPVQDTAQNVDNPRMGESADEPASVTTASFTGVVVTSEPGDGDRVPPGVWVDIEHDDGDRERVLYATDEFPPRIATQILAGHPFRVLRHEHADGDTIIASQRFTLVQATVLSDDEKQRRADIAAAASALLADRASA